MPAQPIMKHTPDDLQTITTTTLGHYNAVAESFFQLLKRERIKRRIYATRDEARSDVFDYIEMFYNPIRRHGSNDGLSPVEFEKQFNVQQQSV